MDDFCARLARWTLAQRWQDLSADAQERARHLLLDTIGCALGGRGHPAVSQSVSIAETVFDGRAIATGLGSGMRRSLLGAILDSGAAIRALDLNDFYWGPGLGGHPSDIFATGFAIAEETDSTIADLLNAVAAGYEFYTRLMDLMRAGDPPWAWDHTCACAPSAAIIAGLLLKLDEKQLAEALAISLARAPVFSALRAGKISSVKAAAPALGQIDGVLAVRLAQAGMTGPKEAVAGARGLEAIIVPGADIARILPPECAESRLLDITIKRFPCMGTGQAATATAVELRRCLNGEIDRIASIDMEVSDSGIVRRQTADIYRRPDRRETADHSFYAIFGMALADGKLEAAQFAAGRWMQPDVVSIVERLTLRPTLPGEAEGLFPARAHVTLLDGSKLTVDMPYAPGHRLNPIGEAGVAEKYRAFAAPAIGADKAGHILDLCLDVRTSARVRDVMAHCAANA